MNPIGTTYSTSRGQITNAQAPNEWVQKTKETLCKFLSQIDLSKVTLPESIEVKSIRQALLVETELGDRHGQFLPVINYQPSYYDGFIILLQSGNEEYQANVAIVGNDLKMHFPFFNDGFNGYCEEVSQTMILNLVHQIADLTHSEISPFESKVLFSSKTSVTSDTLTDRLTLQDLLDPTRNRIEAYTLVLEIKNDTYSLIVTKDCKRGRNFRHHVFEETKQEERMSEEAEGSEGPLKKPVIAFQRLSEEPLLNGGMPFFIINCPRKVIAIAKELINIEPLKMISEENLMLTFKQLGITVQEPAPRVPGWRLIFESNQGKHEVCIDNEGMNSLIIYPKAI